MDQDYTPRWGSEEEDAESTDVYRRSQFQQELMNLFRPPVEQESEPNEDDESEEDDDSGVEASSKRKKRAPRGWRRLFSRLVKRDSKKPLKGLSKDSEVPLATNETRSDSVREPADLSTDRGSIEVPGQEPASSEENAQQNQETFGRLEDDPTVLSIEHDQNEQIEVPPNVPPPLPEQIIALVHNQEQQTIQELAAEQSANEEGDAQAQNAETESIQEHVAEELVSLHPASSIVERPSPAAEQAGPTKRETFGDEFKSRRRYKKVKRAIRELKKDTKDNTKEIEDQQKITHSFEAAQKTKDESLATQFRKIQNKAAEQVSRITGLESKTSSRISPKESTDVRLPEKQIVKHEVGPRSEKPASVREEIDNYRKEADPETKDIKDKIAREKPLVSPAEKPRENKEKRQSPEPISFQEELRSKDIANKPERVFDQRHEIMDDSRHVNKLMPKGTSYGQQQINQLADASEEATIKQPRKTTVHTRPQSVKVKVSEMIDEDLYRQSIQYGVGSALVIAVFSIAVYILR